MVSIISILDLASFLLSIATLLVVVWRSKNIAFYNINLVLISLLLVVVMYNFSNFMEWTGFGIHFDKYGDFIGVLLPMMWAFFFYAFMQNIFNQDIRDRENRFKNLSFHDTLTGFYNRAYYEAQMNHMSRDPERFLPITIICIDIDGLKLINDTLGHQAGDQLLRAVGKIIATVFRKVDIVSRIGGDEFCVLLPCVSEDLALAKKNKIDTLLEEYNANTPGVPISLSIGTASSGRKASENFFDIFKKADDSMYEHKLIHASSRKSKVVEILLAALGHRDFVLQGHAERLSRVAEVMAEYMNLNDEARTNLILLAKVHDVGKIGISDSVFFKEGPLSKDDYEKMKEHSEIGRKIAFRSKELMHVSNLILYHHEAWDGSGYPVGLKGTQIPKECRILAVLDAYDAMTNERPYRGAMSHEDTIAELKNLSGVKYDPAILDEFLKVIDKVRASLK